MYIAGRTWNSSFCKVFCDNASRITSAGSIRDLTGFLTNGRLDDAASKYLNFFFDNNSYDWLDGYTQKYGGGFIWRRSLQKLGDIFRFKDPKPAMMRRPVSGDSVAAPQKPNAHETK